MTGLTQTELARVGVSGDLPHQFRFHRRPRIDESLDEKRCKICDIMYKDHVKVQAARKKRVFKLSKQRPIKPESGFYRIKCKVDYSDRLDHVDYAKLDDVYRYLQYIEQEHPKDFECKVYAYYNPKQGDPIELNEESLIKISDVQKGWKFKYFLHGAAANLLADARKHWDLFKKQVEDIGAPNREITGKSSEDVFRRSRRLKRKN